MSLFDPENASPKRLKRKLARYGTTREVCIIVFALAGAAGSGGRTTDEILAGARRLTRERYRRGKGFHQLRMARLYLSQAGYIKHALRTQRTETSQTGAAGPGTGTAASGDGAFTQVPFTFVLAWRRAELAEAKVAEAAREALEKRFPSGRRRSGRGLLPGTGLLRRCSWR